MLEALAWIVLVPLLAILALRFAFPLPRPVHSPPSEPPREVASALAEHAQALSAAHPEETGIVMLPEPVDALASRIAHVRAATRSVDAQYYIWKADLAGTMLLAELVMAAKRGVRVRVLVDDIPTRGLDPMWAAANSLENFEVRLFNPLAIRRPRPVNYFYHLLRLNRRMHNKAMIFDRAVAIVGGRNIADEYFAAREKGLFIDLDALAVGAAVDLVAEDFDRYWRSVSSFPVEQLLDAPEPEVVASLAEPVPHKPELAREYRAAIDEAQAGALSWQKPDALVWAPVRMFSDSPDKALHRSARRDLVAMRILPIMAGAREQLDLVSGYFVPSRFGTKMLVRLAKRGVAVRIITNSARVTDKRFVHASYIPYRRRLLRAGVRIFEARPRIYKEPRAWRERLKRGIDETARTRFAGGGESVHAKTFTIDHRYLFVGSFNFDPRSAMLNCELGLVIDSPRLTEVVEATLDRRVIGSAYEVTMSKLGKLTWTAGRGPRRMIWDREPDTTWGDRAMLRFYRMLPIEWLM